VGVRRGLPIAIALGALVLAGGCTLRRPHPQPAPKATAAELLDGLRARRAAIGSLRARARLRAGLRAAWTREAIVVRRPGLIRIDVLSPFGLALAMGARDEVLWAFAPGEGIRWEGPTTPENLGRFLGAPLGVPDVVDLLLGLPPARAAVGPATVAATDAGEIALTLPLADGAQTIWFAGDPLVVARAEERRGGAVTLRAAFGDYAAGFPHALTVESPASGSEARLQYDTVEPNAAIDVAVFSPPAAARVLPFEAAPGADEGRP